MNNNILIILIGLFIIIRILYKSGLEKFTQKEINDNIKHYIINLERRSDRITHLQNQIKKYDINFTFFSAIDGNTIDISKLYEKNVLTIKNNIGREFRLGEIGCYLSHLATWNDFLVSGTTDYAIIYEDDFTLHENYAKNLEEIMNEAENINWDIIYLGRNCVKFFKDACITGEYKSKNMYIPNKIGYGTFGYIINKKSAKKLVENALPILEPSDDYIMRLHDEGIIVCYATRNELLTYNVIGTSDTYSSKSIN